MNKQNNTPALRFPEFTGEWEMKKLGEVAEIKTGNTPSTIIAEYYNGNKLFVSPADLQGNRFVINTKTTLTELGFSTGRKIKKGSVLFVCIGSTIGKVGITNEECLTNQQINSLDANTENENRFIYTLLEKNGTEIKLLAGVQAVPQINKTDFSNLSFSFPTLSEQTKIANFLTAVDEKLQGLKKKKALLEVYKKGVMQRLFAQTLRFKDENGKAFAEWEVRKLGEVAKRIITKNKINNANVMTISAQFGLISQLEFFNKSVSAKDVTGYYLLNKDDFAYNKSYSNGYPMGAIKRLNRYDMGVVSTLYICFKFNIGINLSFMEQYFEMGLQNTEIEKVAQEGARNHGLLNIGVFDFLNININLPTLAEQVKIANFLSAIDDKINQTDIQIQKTEQWKRGLLQKMFP